MIRFEGPGRAGLGVQRRASTWSRTNVASTPSVIHKNGTDLVIIARIMALRRTASTRFHNAHV